MLAPLEKTYQSYIENRIIYEQSLTTTSTLRAFVRWVHNTYPGEIYLTQEMLDIWCSKRETEEWNSFVNRISHLKGYIIYLANHGYSDYSVPYYPKKKEHPVYEPIDDKMIMNLIRAADEISNEEYFHAMNQSKGVRRIERQIKAIILPVSVRFAYSSGVRPTETRLLTRKSVDLTNGVIHISVAETKGYRERIIVLDDDVLSLFRQFDQKIDAIVRERKTFFSNAQGEPYSEWWWRNQFRECWDRYNAPISGDVDKPVTAYSLRHNYVIQNIASLEETANHKKMLALSYSLGHSSIKRTLYYSHMTPRLSSALERSAPGFLRNILKDEDE